MKFRIHHTFPCLILVFLLFSPSPRTVSGDDWRQWRGPSRSGTQSDSPRLRDQLPPNGLSPTWVSEANMTGGGGWSSPIVAAGRVFVYLHRQRPKPGLQAPLAQYPMLTDQQKGTMTPTAIDAYEELRVEEQMTRLRDYFDWTDEIVCLDASTGKTLWNHSRPSGATRWRQSSTPVFDAGRLCYLGADRTMVSLDGETGQVAWSTPLPYKPETDEPTVSSPVVVDEAIVVSAGRLLAYDLESGSILWQGDPDTTRSVYSSPTVWESDRGSYVIAHVAKGKTICVAPRTGTILWTIETFAERSSPTVVGDLLLTYGGSRKGGLRCYRLSHDGAENIRMNQRINDSGSSPTVVDGLVFVQGERNLVCVDLVSGETRWSEPINATDSRYTSPASADGKVYFASEGLLCFHATGERMTPVFDAGLVLDNRLVAKDEVRKRLKIDTLEETPEGRPQAQQLWHAEVINPGPLRCTTPALADGKLYLRTNSRIVCFDLKLEQP